MHVLFAAGALDTTGIIALPAMSTAHPAVEEGTPTMIGSAVSSVVSALTAVLNVDTAVPSIDAMFACCLLNVRRHYLVVLS
jgi:hypothetical protein